MSITGGEIQLENFEPEVCLGHCQTSMIELLCKNVIGYKLWTIFAKKLCHRYRNWQGPQYASESIFPLSIYLRDHFKFRVSHFSGIYVNGCQQSYLGFYLAYRWSSFARFEQAGPKILLAFHKIYLGICKVKVIKAMLLK